MKVICNDELNDIEWMLLLMIHINSFFLFVILWKPFVENFCDIMRIPFDLSISAISMGFGNELILLLSLICLFLLHYVLKFLQYLLIKMVKLQYQNKKRY